MSDRRRTALRRSATPAEGGSGAPPAPHPTSAERAGRSRPAFVAALAEAAHLRPGRRLLLLLGAWLLAALALALLRVIAPSAAELAAPAWWTAGALLAAAAAVDFLRRPALESLPVERQLPETLAVNAPNPACMVLVNRGPRAVELEIADDPPATIDMPGLPQALRLAPGERAELHYHLRPRQRGDARFGPPWLRRATPWRLWELTSRPGEAAELKVFPNFIPVSRLATLGLEREIGALGVHLLQRRGEGLDFHQLREFRDGDALRQVDWKATARYGKPISREYQDERDQDIIFLLDCGRRMRTRDSELSHFDHALDALLITAQVALRQGDAVGLMSFAVGTRGERAEGNRWLPPTKGQAAIKRLIHQVYDLHSTPAASDFLDAAERLEERHRKRAMVILVSNVRDEDEDDLLAATELLARRHRVVVANLHEQAAEERIAAPIVEVDDALACLGTLDHVGARQRLLAKLRQRGLGVIDTVPRQLHVELVAEYLRLKRSGAI